MPFHQLKDTDPGAVLDFTWSVTFFIKLKSIISTMKKSLINFSAIYKSVIETTIDFGIINFPAITYRLLRSFRF